MLQPAHFTVQTVDAGVGEVLVYIEDPEGHTEEVWRGHWAQEGFAGGETEAIGPQQEWPGDGCQSHPLCPRRGRPPEAGAVGQERPQPLLSASPFPSQ